MALGDHIKAKRARGIYTHHGIDMGDGTVVHFSGHPLNYRDARVCRVSLEEFLAGREAVVVKHEEPVLPVEETVRLAEELLGAEGYHPLTNNCEHFTTYCKTGRKDSVQSRRFITAAFTAGALAMVVGAGIVRQLRTRNGRPNGTALAQAMKQPKRKQKRT